MKIGLITFHISNNYGALLQTYALHHKLEQLGQKAELIDYRPRQRSEKLELIHKIPKYKPSQNPLRYLLAIPYRFCMDMLTLNKRRQLRTYILQYIKKHYHLSEKQYTSYSELAKSHPHYDLYLVGSDQVWNPHNTGGDFDPAYFFSYIKEEDACASYASSVGRYNIRDKADTFRDYSQNLHWVSVREAQTIPAIKEITGKDAVCVVDPTLLLTSEDWEEISREPKEHPDKFVLVYSLGSNQNVEKVAQMVSAHLKLPIKYIQYDFRLLKNQSSFVRPEEYLWCFAHASFVVTDSFHGTVFSIINRKPFYTVQPESNNSRVLNLLTQLGISDRYFPPEKIPDSIDGDIDYISVQTKLESMRQNSLDYLNTVIKEREKYLE